MASYDIIIKNGTVFDGKGNKPQKIDIGIRGDEIKKIDIIDPRDGAEIIDAADKYVCPGFIDLTNHSDTHWTLFAYPRQESLIKQGITTILGGNCGSSIAPLVKGSGIKSISKWSDISKININWQSLEELFDELEKHKLGLNFATLVGFNTLRYETEDPKEMKFLLDSSMKQGAFGLSTNSKDVETMEMLYEPIKKRNGITKHHLEDEGANVLPSISSIIDLARNTETKTHISHIKILGRGSWKFFGDALKMIRNAREEGTVITSDFFPYERTGSNLYSLMPNWLRKMDESEVMGILHFKKDKRWQDIIEYLKNLTLHYDKIIIASSLFRTGGSGKTILEVSQKMEVPPEEIVLDLLAENNLSVSIFSQVINPEHLLELAKEDYMAFSTDGVGYDLSAPTIPHPRSFGAFPRAFRLFVKENKILDWQTAIHKSTGLPASILGINDRGTLEKGRKADIIIFDPEEINDYATYENPFRFSEGIEYVLINGIIVLINSGLTGKFAGRIIKKK
ncbi:amidohydrolase family protein [Patescibacteria group bacterium]|nr:amidohydrolase family protein [Patescibacteria group bacterium]